jgi:hypothetical protein
MALHDRIALQAGAIGIPAELSAGEVHKDYAGGLCTRLFQRKNKLLAKKDLRSNGIPEGRCGKQFPDVPRVALPPSQFPNKISCKATVRLSEDGVNRTPERLAESSAGAGSVRSVLFNSPGEARWNVCFVTRESA